MRNIVFQVKLIDVENRVSYMNGRVCRGVTSDLKSSSSLLYWEPSTYCLFSLGSSHLISGQNLWVLLRMRTLGHTELVFAMADMCRNSSVCQKCWWCFVVIVLTILSEIKEIPENQALNISYAHYREKL